MAQSNRNFRTQQAQPQEVTTEAAPAEPVQEGYSLTAEEAAARQQEEAEARRVQIEQEQLAREEARLQAMLDAKHRRQEEERERLEAENDRIAGIAPEGVEQ
jgi:hypothetical protein